MDRDDTLAWLTLSRTPGLNASSLTAALEKMGGARAMLLASDRLRASAGIGAAARAYLQSPESAPTASEMRWLDCDNHCLLPYTHADFPPLLRTIADCPAALYVVGNAMVLSEPQLAIVGSRNPTADGAETAQAFAEHLARCGLGIASGLAQGIDTAAHRGALAAGGLTIAVLGTGVDVLYPRGNTGLVAEIAVNGALVSEFALGTPGRPANFPQRNRIIAALALGTLVIEAARHSGSLITARLAGDYGREVFAIPGSIHNPLKRGCHELLRQGAILTESADDILSELNFSAASYLAIGAANVHRRDTPPVVAMDKDHEILLDALGFEPTDLDTLVTRTAFKPATLSSMMLILELMGRVRPEPGGRYSRVPASR